MKYTIEEFIKLLREEGIMVHKVGQKYVYMDEPNQETLPNLSFVRGVPEIRRDWTDNGPDGQAETVTLEQAIKDGSKILAIKIVRRWAPASIDLSKAKAIVFSGWDEWKRILA